MNFFYDVSVNAKLELATMVLIIINMLVMMVEHYDEPGILNVGTSEEHSIRDIAFTIADPDLPALDVLTQILSGQGGRLFLELRDKQSLAYSVTAFDLEGIDPGIWGVYIAGEPAKLGEMKTGIERELHQIVDGPISDEELARAKAYLIGSQAVSLQQAQ